MNFEPLFAELTDEGLGDWADHLKHRCALALDPASHGNLGKWQEAWRQLPEISDAVMDCTDGVRISGSLSSAAASELQSLLMQFHPWRKGPFQLCDIFIDTEWRSDWKWERLRDHVELRNRSVLDVGSGNGYYGWRMLAAGARRVIGLDPFPLYVMQHAAIKRYAGANTPNYVLPVGDDCLEYVSEAFDTAFSMGVLYHRSSPIDHLQAMFGCLRPGGQLVLETLIVEGAADRVLVPESRYAKMRNVWFIPSVELLQRWLKRTGFGNIKVINITATSVGEQRSTDWMTFESLPDFLDPEDSSLTVEGYPAPVRVIVTADRRGR